MTDRTPLSEGDILAMLDELPGWSFSENRLQKRFEFTSFREAISFIVRMSFEAEEMGHHPEITNVYNRVDISLTTHDAGNRVTSLDVVLARAIERFSWI